MALDGALMAEGLTWFAYYVPVRLKAAWMHLTRPGPAVWFAPDKPRPWYLVWAAAAWAGARIARRPEEALAGFYFDDSARGLAPNTGPERRFNWRCTDVTKSHLARVFEQTFGYPLMVDPTTAEGGYPNVNSDNWYGLIMPAATPADIQKRVHAAAVAALKSAAVSEQFAKVGGLASPSTPQEYAAFITAEQGKWGKIIKAIGFKQGTN